MFGGFALRFRPVAGGNRWVGRASIGEKSGSKIRTTTGSNANRRLKSLDLF